MEPAPEDLDVQAYCRSLALQQIEMLTRLAEIAMQLAEAEGARAIAAQTRAAQPKIDEITVQAARAEAQEAGVAFSRFSRSVHRSLALRAHAADRLLAGDKARIAKFEADRPDRRTRHRDEVEDVLGCMISDEVEDPGRAEALNNELAEKVEDLYRDEEVRVEDRPLGSVMEGLACGLGLSGEWRRWRGESWPAEPRPSRPAGDPAAVKAERDRRRAAVTAAVERDFAECAPPDRLAGLRAGLAARLQEPDVIEWLDTETVAVTADRLCRSLGLGFRVYTPDTG